ncbi:MAG TPA: Gfo/Idh/MocA family oxidoreductase [Pyrinomonadaceae bacterium]|jgi:predicted dehydrogenase|nr:Gfo/Idh/MocA family oxidoreductase [Pyrinomonadaceae bacterium]
MSSAVKQVSSEIAPRRPRLGFVGLGWIGRSRMESVMQADVAEICALHDVTAAMANEGQKLAPDAPVFSSFDELLDQDLDGIVIATPNCFHAEQAIAALERGMAVFCQKPLGRNAAETRSIVAAARESDSLLGVDLTYRHIPAMQRVRSLVEIGALGKVFAVDAKFHNAYGPDKPWFYDLALSGGGCVLDLGVHLIDLALEPLRFPALTRVEAALFSAGRLLPKGSREVEDYGVATIETADNTVINLGCSWNLHAGRPANIEISFYGTEGGASLHNVDGSFYDFAGERFNSTEKESLTSAEDLQWKWAGLATLEWVEKLAANERFDPAVERLITVAEIMDTIYGPEA